MTTVGEIYDVMDKIAPFKNADKYDNSGLLVGAKDAVVTKAIVALDITNDVIDEAKAIGAELIISHHPVMNYNYEPFSAVTPDMPIYRLAAAGIAAVCSHTPLDVAVGGINDIIYDMLKAPLALSDNPEVLEVTTADGLGYGKIVGINREIKSDDMAKILKDVFGCTVVKYCGKDKPLKKLAFCSGGGGSILSLAKEKGADAYICGDVKHDRWIFANNYGISLFDCGHYHTEVIMQKYISDKLKENIQNVEFTVSKTSEDPVKYAL